MRVVSLHPDVLIATSAIWQTNCVIVRSGDETFVIDSPVLPEELEALPSLLSQAKFGEPNGLLATHGDWDHLLGRLVFPDIALGCAQSTCERMSRSPGAAQRELREFDRSFYIERPRTLMLGDVQSLPVPGRCSIGERELELHTATGHTEDGMTVAIPWARVLVVGDYLSPVEPPKVSPASSTEAYIETLERLRPLVGGAEHIVPGHGPILDASRALETLEEHIASLGAPSANT